MSDFTVALADVRRVTGLGDFASRSILAKPTPLPFANAKPGPRGGNSQRLYSLRDIDIAPDLVLSQLGYIIRPCNTLHQKRSTSSNLCQ